MVPKTHELSSRWRKAFQIFETNHSFESLTTPFSSVDDNLFDLRTALYTVPYAPLPIFSRISYRSIMSDSAWNNSSLESVVFFVVTQNLQTRRGYLVHRRRAYFALSRNNVNLATLNYFGFTFIRTAHRVTDKQK